MLSRLNLRRAHPALTVHQLAALATPAVLVLSMYWAFQSFTEWLGHPLGYLAAFVLYWVGWCIILPAALLGGVRSLVALFRPGDIGFVQLGWKTQALLWWPLIAPLGVLLSPLSPLSRANAAIVAVSVLLGIIIGVTEEILWRGVYARLFPQQLWLNTIYPTIGFALWHLAPLSVVSTRYPGAPYSFLLYCVLLGLSYAAYARKTGSIRWCTISHVIHDTLGMGALVYAVWLS
jgi:membrane protease YdiL (CAAX protease family)